MRSRKTGKKNGNLRGSSGRKGVVCAEGKGTEVVVGLNGVRFHGIYREKSVENFKSWS